MKRLLPIRLRYWLDMLVWRWRWRVTRLWVCHIRKRHCWNDIGGEEHCAICFAWKPAPTDERAGEGER